MLSLWLKGINLKRDDFADSSLYSVLYKEPLRSKSEKTEISTFKLRTALAPYPTASYIIKRSDLNY